MWILPITSWFFFALLFVRQGGEWRVAWLAASVLWGGLVAFHTEILSCFGQLTAGGLAVCWGLTAAVAVLANLRLKQPWPRWKYGLHPSETWLVAGTLLIAGAAFVTAVLAPPNTWDSMTYHMSRVMHWLQNRSVEHYPTHILRQLEMNPWAEFAITHFQALSGGDRFANLIQWFSMAGSLVGVSLIAEKLGGDRRAQLFSAVLAVSLPMGILQASSTQNDYVVAFWLVCLAWSGLQFSEEKTLKWALFSGASLGLAILSKGTAYLYAFPFVLWFAWAVFRGSLRQAWSAGLAIVVLSLSLNVFHFERNYRLFGSPLGSGESKFFNEQFTPAALFSNLLRNTSLQLLSPMEGLNRSIKTGVVQLHDSFALDIDDPKTTWVGTKYSDRKAAYDEDSVANVLHAVIFAALLFALPFQQVLRRQRVLTCYISAVVAGYLLFCLLLKWQPWHSRLLLPLFVLGTPAAGVIAARCCKVGVMHVVSVLLLAAALPFALSNAHRPLLHISKAAGLNSPLLTYDRNMYYFVNRWDLYEQYVQVAGDIRQCKATRVGLVTSGDGWEYPLWVLIKQNNPVPVRIEHIEVKNASQVARRSAFVPDYSLRIE